MKVALVNLSNQKSKELDLPSQCNEQYRPDVIKRAVLALQSAARQAYGTNPEAGKRSSSDTSKRRRKYRGTYGFGISRVNRKIHSRRGTRMHWVGAFSPQTRGGRRAHPPTAEKKFEQQINRKENRLAIRSAIAASFNKEIVKKRGHKIPENYPFIVENSFEDVAKTSQVKDILEKLGFKEELNRTLIKKIRAGIGKLRGRKYRRKKGILIIVGNKESKLVKTAKNIAGIEVAQTRELNAQMLAPGALAGRAALWTQAALEELREKNLFK